MSESQCRRILEWCKTHDGITVREAAYGLECFCLHKRIAELKQEGHRFVEKWEEHGKGRHIRHRLVQEPVQLKLA